MAKTLFVVPGLFGSTLDAPGSLITPRVWVDYTALALGRFFTLGLAADGTSPLPPHGQPATVSGLLRHPYVGMRAGMRARLPAADWTVLSHPYDWRKDPRLAAASLANAIRQAATPDSPASIVGHSLGGLVARLAWADLAFDGAQALLERIITICTPHLGSYSWPLCAGEGDPTISGVLLAQSVTAATYIPGNPFGSIPAYSWPELVATTATWPGMYCLLPPLAGDWQVTDPNRDEVYQAASWPQSHGIQQAWLDEARNQVQALLAGPSTRPPAGKLVCLVSRALPTAGRLDFPPALGFPGAFVSREDGDGTVTATSQQLAGYPFHHVSCDHVGAATDPRALDLAALLLRGQPAPATQPGPPLYLSAAMGVGTRQGVGPPPGDP